jgi:hypothetical protein
VCLFEGDSVTAWVAMGVVIVHLFSLISLARITDPAGLARYASTFCLVDV